MPSSPPAPPPPSISRFSFVFLPPARTGEPKEMETRRGGVEEAWSVLLIGLVLIADDEDEAAMMSRYEII